jgi:hypothetical protein
VLALPAVLTLPFEMPARPPVLRALGLIPFHMSLLMGIIIVAIRVGVIGIVIIGRGGLVAIITRIRIVPPIICIRHAGDEGK